MMTLDDIKPGHGQEIDEPETKVSRRTQSRRVALQALYQWQLNSQEAYEIVKQFQEEGLLDGLEFDFFKTLLDKVTSTPYEYDALYAEFLDRDVKRLDPIEKSILRMGVYELQSEMQTPYKVVINESVELAKRFGAEESHKYINGVLDKVAQNLRSLEMG
jgi:N utilization substance protein B